MQQKILPSEEEIISRGPLAVNECLEKAGLHLYDNPIDLDALYDEYNIDNLDQGHDQVVISDDEDGTDEDVASDYTDDSADKCIWSKGKRKNKHPPGSQHFHSKKRASALATPAAATSHVDPTCFSAEELKLIFSHDFDTNFPLD
jgi:hypothetical protein